MVTQFIFVSTKAADNEIFIDQAGNNFSLYVYQDINGDHRLQLFSQGDNQNINLGQVGDASHQALIDISGSEPYTINLIQEGNIGRQANVVGSCVTVGGCAVTIIQTPTIP